MELYPSAAVLQEMKGAGFFLILFQILKKKLIPKKSEKNKQKPTKTDRIIFRKRSNNKSGQNNLAGFFRERNGRFYD